MQPDKTIVTISVIKAFATVVVITPLSGEM
jgi:hypothetical protein